MSLLERRRVGKGCPKGKWGLGVRGGGEEVGQVTERIEYKDHSRSLWRRNTWDPFLMRVSACSRGHVGLFTNRNQGGEYFIDGRRVICLTGVFQLSRVLE